MQGFPGALISLKQWVTKFCLSLNIRWYPQNIEHIRKNDPKQASSTVYQKESLERDSAYRKHSFREMISVKH